MGIKYTMGIYHNPEWEYKTAHNGNRIYNRNITKPRIGIKNNPRWE